jgi:hypothetical protein
VIRARKTKADIIPLVEMELANAVTTDSTPLNDRAGPALEHVEQQDQRPAVEAGKATPHPGVRVCSMTSKSLGIWCTSEV